MTVSYLGNILGHVIMERTSFGLMNECVTNMTKSEVAYKNVKRLILDSTMEVNSIWRVLFSYLAKRYLAVRIASKITTQKRLLVRAKRKIDFCTGPDRGNQGFCTAKSWYLERLNSV